MSDRHDIPTLSTGTREFDNDGDFLDELERALRTEMATEIMRVVRSMPPDTHFEIRLDVRTPAGLNASQIVCQGDR